MKTSNVGVAIDAVSKRYKSAKQPALDGVTLDIRPGELLALLGPSGSGKTTLLNVLAGLESADDGRMLFGDQDVTDIPAERRSVAVVFQSSMLYPHMSLRKSIAFAPRLNKVPDAEIEQRIADITGWLHIAHLLDRRPHEVSGGERQRAAIAKALVSRPALLLMDEPFSAVDAQLRRQLRSELVKLHREFGTTTVFVTHDQEEAMAISDRVAVMRNGRLVQVDEPLELYRSPVNAWLADFVGVQPINVLPVRRSPSGDTLQTADGELTLKPEGRAFPDVLDLGVRPEHIKIIASGSASPLRVYTREVVSGQMKYTLRTDQGTEIVAIRGSDDVLDIDTPVDVAVDWRHAIAFDSTTGERLDVSLAKGTAGVS
jgi:multiple sugar transport system ATP-binding protein